MSNEDYDRVIATNLTGAFYTLRAAANHISDYGRIIVNGSVSRSGLWPGIGVSQ
jgi:NAD(P)-dependent dehydrogenase (short-subunit alcohol dehydrogenase family)